MSKQIIIAEQERVAAIFSEDRIEEIVVSTSNQQVGDIYLGTVENVIPGIDAAFVNIGDADRNGFMHVTDLGPLRLKRSAGAITELLLPQQKVLVQVMKEPTGNKGPRLTGNITLPGRYLVLTPYGHRGVSLSQRIDSEAERSRLRALAILIKPAGMGAIVRTEAEGQSEEAIIKDLETLQQQWESIQQQALTTSAPALLNRDDDFIQRVLRDLYSNEVNRIVVDTPGSVKRVKQQLSNWSEGKMPSGTIVERHNERLPILEYFRVNGAIREALKPRVDLPSGGYIIIEPTEALTVVDVNSGSFTQSATSRETVLWTNREAAVEIARQLRLRKIGGVIVVDFIDMDARRDRLQVLEAFEQALKNDKSRPQIAQLTELGLVELTRKRQGQSLSEIFGRTCPSCGGLGHLVWLPGDREPAPTPIATVPAAATSSPRAPDKRSPELDSVADLSESEDERELELLPHPSYPEPGSNSRRRRRRLSEAPSKPEPASKSKPRNNGSVERERKPEPEKAPAPAPMPAPEPASERPSRREEPPKPAPPVEVEMTPLEQEVYAFMGLSPLIRLDRSSELGETMPVAVAVKPATAEAAQESDREFDPENSETSAPVLATDVFAPEPSRLISEWETSGPINLYEEYESGDLDGESEDSQGDTRLAEDPSDRSSTEFEAESEEEFEDNPPVVRRRRRRSSAASSE